MGTSASAEVLQEINSRYGSTFFGERFAPSRSAFMQNCVQPLYQGIQQLAHVAESIVGLDAIVPLRDIQAFTNVPNAMRIPILCHPGVQELLASGRIDGWGYLPEDLPQWHADDARPGANPYQRLMDNGYVPGLIDAIDEDGNFTVRARINVDDPYLTLDDKESLRITYRIVDQILAETNLDPTSIANMRG